MTHDYRELAAMLARTRARWRRTVMLRAFGLAAGAAALFLAASLGLYVLARPTDLWLIGLALLAICAVLGCFAYAAWSVGRPPSDQRVARFLEERFPELEDRLATAIAFGERSRTDGIAVGGWLISDVATRIRDLDFSQVVRPEAVRRAILVAAAGLALLTVMMLASRIPASRALDAAAFYVFPSRLRLEVQPGHARIAPGSSLRITAYVRGADRVMTPVVELGPVAAGDAGSDGRAASTKVMTTAGRKDEFVVTVDDVRESFKYRVSAGSVTSSTFAVHVLGPPHVTRIDLSYEYPARFGLKNRVEEDSGDIYAPIGTTVRLRVQTDKPVTSAEMVKADGSRQSLTADGATVLQTAITVTQDDSYRIALSDAEGLRNPGETEYFVRTLTDRPPEVRIDKPTGDLEVTPLQEVTVEVHANDDYGIEQLDLVYAVRGGRERAVTLSKEPSGLTVTGSHVLYLEDLSVEPGDFVTYFARARDVGRGRKGLEVRSDIFFLEVKPYDQEFVAAQSEAASSGNERSLEELAQAQKDIIVATWKLDRRAVDARAGQSREDILQVARAQGEVQERARETAAGLQFAQASGGLRGGRGTARGVSPSTGNPVFEALVKATVAMGHARTELQALNTATATPHEMEALNQILKALAEIRRRQVNRSQQANASGGGNRAQRDLSTLFDRELRRQQETNYERSSASDRQPDQTESETLQRLRELARRQADLNRQQRELARAQTERETEERKRQLERLTREQTDLRRQTEELSQSLSEAAGEGRAGGGRSMREISERMRSAAADLRRNDPGQASRNSDKALEGLEQLEREMRQAAPGAADPESQKLADQLGRAQKAREQMTELQHRIEQLMKQIEVLRGQQAPRANGGRGQGGPEGPRGDLDKLAKLEDELQTALGQARELMTALGRSEGGGFGVTPEGQQLSRSAAGIESYKHDFSRWDTLKRDINLAFERLEVSLARRLVERESRERLNAGGDARVPEAYRELVDAYYRSLARK
jgi:hypothetical protein